MLLSLLFLSCSTVSESSVASSSRPDAVPDPRELQRDAAYGEVRSRIRTGTAMALQEAMSMIRKEGLDRDVEGRELFYIAQRLSRTLYPLMFTDEQIDVTPQGSPFPSLFDTALSGTFPGTGGEKASFLTLLTSSLVLLTLPCSFDASGPVPPGLDEAAATAEQLVALDGKTVLPRYLLGRYAEYRGDIPGASFWYEIVLALDNVNYPALEGFGRTAFLQGNYAESAEAWYRLTERFPREYSYRLRGLESYLAAGESEKADALLSELIQEYPETPEVVTKRPLLLEQFGRYEQASRLLSVLERSYGETPALLVTRARLLLQRGRDEEALQLLETLGKGYQDPFSQAMYEQTLIESGNVELAQALLDRTGQGRLSIAARKALLQEAVAENDWNEAELQIAVLLEIDEDNGPFLREAVKIYLNLGDLDRAYQYASILTGLEDATPGDRLLLTEILLARGDNESLGQGRSLLASLKEETLGSPERSQLYYLESRMAPSEEAELELLRSALLEDLQNVDALVAIAELHRNRGDLKKAYRYMSQAAYLLPSDEELGRELRALEAALGGGEGFLGNLSSPEIF